MTSKLPKTQLSSTVDAQIPSSEASLLHDESVAPEAMLQPHINQRSKATTTPDHDDNNSTVAKPFPNLAVGTGPDSVSLLGAALSDQHQHLVNNYCPDQDIMPNSTVPSDTRPPTLMQDPGTTPVLKKTHSVKPPIAKNISKTRGTTIGSEALVVLTSSYSKYFAEYCRGRKKVVQKVPATVWKSVYQDYLVDQQNKCSSLGQDFKKEDLPQERTLQDALRSALNEIGTGVSDECGSKKATLQDDNLMLRLKHSDTYNKKKMCEFRESLVSTADRRSASPSEHLSINGLDNRDKSSDFTKKRMKKKELLEDTERAITDMVKVVESGSTDFCAAVKEQNTIVNADVHGKMELRKSQQAALDSEEIDRKLKRLVMLRDNGIISDADFKGKMRSIAGV